MTGQRRGTSGNVGELNDDMTRLKRRLLDPANVGLMRNRWRPWKLLGLRTFLLRR